MNEKHEQLIADYLKGNLDEQGKQKIEELLAKGEIDFIDFRAMEQLYDELKMVPVPEPGPQQSSRFYEMLEKQKQLSALSITERIAVFFKKGIAQLTMPRLAYACLLLIAGGFIGVQFGNNDEEMEQLSTQMQEMRQMMMISMLEGPSTTDRLKAVHISSQITSADDQAVSALLFTLNNDPSINVRVQAIEALKRWGKDEYVRKGLINAIAKQESPIVIIELADAMIELELKNSAKEFKQLLEERELEYNVKQKLESSIAALS
ncbi:MAG: HEAT repeat domain-containing protein [Balneolaceae bacterium]|nr:HEAT repeat domain-containing protein [Balneolaceae bacterium]